MSQSKMSRTAAFTLVELLVVVSIIALLIAIVLPSMRKARAQGKSTICLSNLRVLGQGQSMYALDHSDALVPARMPNLQDGVNWRMQIAGGLKYRPTFLATMGAYVGVPAFDDPQSTKAGVDRFGEPGDRQNYASRVYVCPEVPTWRDERNGAYGYNYQFLGNARLLDTNQPTTFKNWPVSLTRVRTPANCVAVADCMGTAASYTNRQPYFDDHDDPLGRDRDPNRYGNEGFNLDPPRVDPEEGEMANFDRTPQSRTAVDPRHLDRSAVLWVDSHATRTSAKMLGYELDEVGVFTFDGDNRLFNVDGSDTAWRLPNGLASAQPGG